MRVAIIGGGPGGLYAAALLKQLDPERQITVWERNAAGDTFGFGVVFSDETLGAIESADTVIHERMSGSFARWDDIDIRFRGTTLTSGGQGFAAMNRRELLGILQDRCAELGVTLRFGTEAPDLAELSATQDLVIACDGVHSLVRAGLADTFRPSLDQRCNRFMWLGTDKVFEAFTFDVRETPYGVMQVHAYPYARDASTFIIEMHESVWQSAGFADFDDRDWLPGESDHKSISLVASLFEDLLDGHQLQANNSRWRRFVTVKNETWRHGNVVLLGDAAHTAHFSIGSGTKLAMEDALALAACLHEQRHDPRPVEAGLAAYEAERRPVVDSVQRAAQASLEWFERIGDYTHQAPEQFAFNLLTRSRRITYDNLRLRDPEFLSTIDDWFAGDQPVSARPPMFQPLTIRGLTLANRVVVSPMDMYSAEDGLPGDFHLVHLGGKAMGGAGLVMTEMVCVSEQGRITPGCTGLYTDEQQHSWQRIVDFVHARSDAKIGAQLGHSGRKGSTRLMWEGIDQPLPQGNWPIVAPSPLPYLPQGQQPRELTANDLDDIEREFLEATERAALAGFDLLELHCAHGYLLSSFLSPLTNRRTDSFGGDLAGRLRFPLRVFDRIRAVWPAERPVSVRISATDWAEGGNGIEEGVAIARAFAEHGADAIHVSSGQVVKEERPAFGRSYQTPLADRIRNEVAPEFPITVIAVGAISSHEDVNAVLLAGRADLVALGRSHLYDPHWTLHAAAEQEYTGPGARWPAPFAAGSRRPPQGRTDGPPPRLQLVRAGVHAGTRHARWIP